jgi:hypothetical protein
MKYIIIISASLFFIWASEKIYGEYRLEPDKKLHLEAGIIIGGASYFICPKFEELIFDKSRIHPAIWSIGMAALAGAGKEIIYDDRMGRGNPDAKDFYYTVLGGAISGLAFGILEAVFKIKNNNLIIETNLINKNFFISCYYSY